MLLINKIDKIPAFVESGIKLDPSESSWSKPAHFPCWRLSPTEQNGEVPRWAGLLTGPQGCSDMRSVPTAGKAGLKPSLRTKQQSSWHLYLPAEQTGGMAAGRSVCLGCLQCSHLRSTLCCCRTVYSPFRKHFRSVRNSRFSPSKTGSAARSPWDWEVK